MKKIKIALIITLILSIAFTGIYIIGYPKLVKKGNINVKYTSEATGNSDTPSESPLNFSSDSTAEENYEIVNGYFQYILTIETSEHLKEGWILATIEGTLYNAYQNYIFFAENNKQIFLNTELSSDWSLIFSGDDGNIYCLNDFEFNTKEDKSTAKYWANEITYITITPFTLIKNPPLELINPKGETSE